MANNLITVDQIAAEVLLSLQDELVLGNLVFRDKTEDFGLARGGFKVGDQIRLRQSTEYETREFTTTVDVQDTRQSNRTFEITNHWDISTELTSREMALDLDDFTREIIQPASVSLAHKIEEGLGMALAQSSSLYTSSDLFATAADMAAARSAANTHQIPMPNRIGIADNVLEAKLLGADYFHRADVRSAPESVPALRDARLGRVMGIDWYGSLYFPVASRTAGDGTTTTDNAGGTMNMIGMMSLNVASTTGTFAAGDKIHIAGVRRHLTVATEAPAASTSIDLVDPIDEIIPDGAAVTVVSAGDSYEHQSVICDPMAFAYATPPLDLPPDADSSVMTANGISIRVVREYDARSKTTIISFDLLFGSVAYDPRKSMLCADIA